MTGCDIESLSENKKAIPSGLTSYAVLAEWRTWAPQIVLFRKQTYFALLPELDNNGFKYGQSDVATIVCPQNKNKLYLIIDINVPLR